MMPDNAPAQPSQAPRWRRRKDARPDEIIAAALEVFGEDGYAAAKLDDIAAKAGVSKGTLYLYFDTKEELFKAVIQSAIGQNLAVAEDLTASFTGPTPDLIRGIVTLLADRILNSKLPRILKLVIGELGRFPELGRYYHDEVISRGIALLTKIVKRGIERGEFRDLDPGPVARLVIAPLLLSAVWKGAIEPLGGAPLDVAAMRDTHLDVLLTGLAKREGAPS
ncbi:MAG: TetR/AcrR family transcriptional regulator [Sphingomonadales bacterium]|nr:TetR/AcrR family transcriptional regulator [Sphingomonadales bacterium]